MTTKLLKMLVCASMMLVSIGCPVNTPNFEGLRKRFLSSNISYQNDIGTLGVGVVNPCDYSFDLLLDTLGNKQVHISSIETQEYVIPLIHKPGYLLFYTVVKEVHTNYYEIYLNDTDTAFVKKTEFDYYEWPDFLMKTISVLASTGYTDRSNSESATELDESTNFVIKSVQGDWIKVNEQLENGTLSEIEYWIKWRDDEKMLITPIFLM